MPRIILFLLVAALATAAAPTTSQPAPATNPAPLATESALGILKSISLYHPNPFIRASAYHDHDQKWHTDLAANTFSLDIRDPLPRKLSGTFLLGANNDWSARFDDFDKLSKPWTPPSDVSFDSETARKALIAMCDDWSFDARLKRLGTVLKTAQSQPTSNGFEISQPGIFRLIWHIDLKARKFEASEAGADTANSYDGLFGWDKNKNWTAWPTFVTNFQAGHGGTGALAIPLAVSPPDHTAIAPDTKPINTTR